MKAQSQGIDPDMRELECSPLLQEHTNCPPENLLGVDWLRIPKQRFNLWNLHL